MKIENIQVKAVMENGHIKALFFKNGNLTLYKVEEAQYTDLESLLNDHEPA